MVDAMSKAHRPRRQSKSSRSEDRRVGKARVVVAIDRRASAATTASAA
jgi:hypothetical protein